MEHPMINPNDNLTTLINVFEVDPSRQEDLVQLLVAATEEVMQLLPGFVSASIHASDDGTRVTNYAQWTSTQAYQAMLDEPTAQGHMKTAAAVAESFEPHLYRVRSSHHVTRTQR